MFVCVHVCVLPAVAESLNEFVQQLEWFVECVGGRLNERQVHPRLNVLE